MNVVRPQLEAEVRARASCGRPAGWYYLGPADLVLREGRQMEPTVYDADVWGLRGVEQQCYLNARLLAAANPDHLRYVEGYAAGIFACLHAWCVDGDRNVVDPTWTGDDDRPEPRDYVGLALPTDYIIGAPVGVCLLDDWRHDYPLCQRPLDEVFSQRTLKGGNA